MVRSVAALPDLLDAFCLVVVHALVLVHGIFASRSGVWRSLCSIHVPSPGNFVENVVPIVLVGLESAGHATHVFSELSRAPC